MAINKDLDIGIQQLEKIKELKKKELKEKELKETDTKEIEQLFGIAAAYITIINKLKDIVPVKTKLAFYPLFKQISCGDCNKPKPSLLALSEWGMWNLWNSYKEKNADEKKPTKLAIAYIELALETIAAIKKDSPQKYSKIKEAVRKGVPNIPKIAKFYQVTSENTPEKIELASTDDQKDSKNADVDSDAKDGKKASPRRSMA